jgi:hypothetical protein
MGYPEAWLLGAWAHAMLGHEDEVDWADKWQNPTRSWLLRWEKGLVQMALRCSLF